MASGPSGSAYTSLPAIANLSGFGMGQPTGVSGRMGKRIAHQTSGSLVGRKGSGTSQITGGDPMAHMVEQYGKQGPPGLDDLDGTSY